MTDTTDMLLQVRDLRVRFRIDKATTFEAVKGIKKRASIRPDLFSCSVFSVKVFADEVARRLFVLWKMAAR